MSCPVDVKSLRDEFESNTEWNLRRQFLEANKDSLLLDRLVCLSRCFVNMAVYSCSYPSAVMQDVHQRSNGIISQEIEISHKGNDGKVVEKRKKTTLQRRHMGIQFVKASDSFTSMPPSNADSPQLDSSLCSDQTENPNITVDDATRTGDQQPPFGVGTSTSHTSNPIASLPTNQSHNPSDSKVANVNKPISFSPPPHPSQHPQRPASSLAHQDYKATWRKERDPVLTKLRKLAYEISALKSDDLNAKAKIHTGADKVPLTVECVTNRETTGAKNGPSVFVCEVIMDGISIASGHSSKIKDAKTKACEAALHKVFMPHMRIVSSDSSSTKLLEASTEPFDFRSQDSPKSAICDTGQKEVFHQNQIKPNLESRRTGSLKRAHFGNKRLDDFVIVVPKDPTNEPEPTGTLSRSADLNRMSLDYEFPEFDGKKTRCVLKIENVVLADIIAIDLVEKDVKRQAASQALDYLKTFCWTIKLKQYNSDSDMQISKEDIVNEVKVQSDCITEDNVGNRMLRRMGWSGGGVGKHGDGIAEPVSMKSVFNRQGLGLGTENGSNPQEFRKKIQELMRNFIRSENQEEVVFSHDLTKEERVIIHSVCRPLHLVSKSRGKGDQRFLCISRKRTMTELFDHLMSVGGETSRYQLVPPGSDLASLPQSTTPS